MILNAWQNLKTILTGLTLSSIMVIARQIGTASSGGASDWGEGDWDSIESLAAGGLGGAAFQKL